jgi:hypothetical protein
MMTPIVGCARHCAWAWLLLVSSSCERERSPANVAPAAVASAKRTAAPAVSSAPRAAAPHGPAAAHGAPTAIHDLLRQSDVQVTISSFRDRRSVGEFMADGRSDTTWRPNPPDPAPWVEVVVPASARVHEVRVALEASPLLDQLSVQVSRDGKVWGRAEKGEPKVRVSSPGSQSGGTFRVTFEQSGRASGRSVAVTSLTFGGDVVDALAEATPSVAVKGAGHALAEPFVSWARHAPYSTREAMCERYHELRTRMPTQRAAVDAGAPESSNCSLGKTLKVEGTPPAGFKALHVAEVDWGVDDEVSGPMRPSLLVFETEQGFRPADFVLYDGYGARDTRAAVAYVSLVTDAEWRGERLVMRHVHRRVVSGGYGDDATSAATLTVMSCTIASGVTKGGVACERALIAYGDAHGQESMWMLSENAKALWAAPRAWIWERSYALSPSGKLRVGSCRGGGEAKDESVACYATLLP